MWWSAWIEQTTASGSERAIHRTASPSAGPVPRAVGSAITESAGSPAAVATSWQPAAWEATVTTCTVTPSGSTPAMGARSRLPPPRPPGHQGFGPPGPAARLSGQSRVPLPPARITACSANRPALDRARGRHAEQRLGARLLGELGGPVGLLPGQVEVVATEVPVGGHLLVDRPAQLQVAD